MRGVSWEVGPHELRQSTPNENDHVLVSGVPVHDTPLHHLSRRVIENLRFDHWSHQ